MENPTDKLKEMIKNAEEMIKAFDLSRKLLPSFDP